MSTLKASHPELRFDLELLSYPKPEVVQDVCFLIYQSADSRLSASLHSTPYTVGRSFTKEAQEDLADKLRALQVGFRFQARPPFTDVISFDPSAKAEEESIKAPFFTKRQLLISVAALVLLVLVGLSVILFFPQMEAPGTDSSEAIAQVDQSGEAQIEEVTGRVEHRRQRSLNWEASSAGVQLQNRDSVRTLVDSKSEILYREGQRLEMEENSLVIIGESQLTPEKVLRHELNLEDGNLKAELLASENPQEFQVTTPQGRLQLRSPRLEEGERNSVQAEIRGTELRISVIEGRAEFQSEGSSETFEITPAAELRKVEGQSPAVKQVVPLPLRFPPNNHSFQNSETPQFSWAALPGITSYELVIASDQEMKDILFRQRSSEPQLQLSFLDNGNLFWQVRAESSSSLYRSEVRKIYVP